jgi:uncharacterized protein YaaN involved in tellurite resistance
MDKLEPPSPSEITASDPVEEMSEEKAASLLSDLPADQRQELESRADAWLDTVTSLNPHSQEFAAEVNAIGNMARRTFERTGGTSSRFMEQSLRQAREGGSAQESVSKSLAELRTTMESLAPVQQGAASKALSFLPGRNAAKRYYRSFESNQKQLDGVLQALARGKEMLQRDNAELTVERRTLWEDLGALQRASHLLRLLDERIVRRVEEAHAAGSDDIADGLERDVLFAVRQRRQDVATQIAVTVQSYLAMGLIEDNNTKLAQGVERARTTTVTALRTAVITAQALENQKLVLDQIDAVNRTTDDLIGRTSEMLAKNTHRIQEQASTSGVSAETLEKALDNLFRVQANQTFLTTVTTLEEQVERAQPYLRRMQQDPDEQASLKAAADLLEVED